jgi:hypothetical protein
MCINYNAFGLVLHPFLWNGIPITFANSPKAYHELTAPCHITCVWTLFQELLWSCTPHMNGQFRDYRRAIHLCVSVSGVLIEFYFLRIQELSHEVLLSHAVLGIQHELLHHFVKTLSQNTNAGSTRSVLMLGLLILTQL